MGCVGGISRAEGVRGDAKLEAVKELPPRLYLGRIALGALQDVMLLALPDNLFRLLDSEGKPRLARLSISRSFESVSELAFLNTAWTMLFHVQLAHCGRGQRLVAD